MHTNSYKNHINSSTNKNRNANRSENRNKNRNHGLSETTHTEATKTITKTEIMACPRPHIPAANPNTNKKQKNQQTKTLERL